MSTAYDDLRASLQKNPRKWLVTGAAGFIGSHLVETLLGLGQEVVGTDNFATGHQRNLDDVRRIVGEPAWGRFAFSEGDLTDEGACDDACAGCDYVLHQGGLGSVPRSIEEPAASHASNVTGTLNLLIAAKQAGVKRVVYASSSSVYGDEPALPKVEEKTGNLLSPYAATKWMDEIYAGVFARCYEGFEAVGLRYFNVFGPRQDPGGAYAAVIPKWTAAMVAGEPVYINGDGETSRDFCYVANVVQANLLAATSSKTGAANRAYNVAVGERTTLNELFTKIRDSLGAGEIPGPVYQDFRAGDVRHSLADIGASERLLGYVPTHSLGEGLAIATPWYREQLAAPGQG